jgi:hypothetical protein
MSFVISITETFGESYVADSTFLNEKEEKQIKARRANFNCFTE